MGGIMISLDTICFFVRMVILKPINFIWCLDKFWVLSHHSNNRLTHFTKIIFSVTFVGTNISSTESIDLKLDDTSASINTSVFLTKLNIFSFEFECNRGHGETIKIPCKVRA